MRLRRLLVGAAAGVGAAVAGNRWVAARASPLAAPLPGEERTYRWRGLDVAYTTAGDPDDPDVLLLHGVHAAASSNEFAPVVERLAEEYHVLAPDLPGFGRSDRPPIAYTAPMYRDFVAAFAEDHTDHAVCIASSLTGAYAADVATDVTFARLVLVCPTDDVGPRRRWLRALVRSPVLGEALFNAFVSRPSLAVFDRREGYLGDPPAAVLDYQWQTAHQPGARFAPASFVGGYLTPERSLDDALSACEEHVTLVWGREATRPPLVEGRALADHVDARLVVVDGARSLPHAEQPESFVSAVADDLGTVARDWDA